MNGVASTVTGSDDGFMNGAVNVAQSIPIAGKIAMVNGVSGGKLYAEFLRDSQVGKASEGLKRRGSEARGSESGSLVHKREEGESVAGYESLGAELVGRLNTL
jgi:hypothetical protein